MFKKIVVAFITKQIDYTSLKEFSIVGIISSLFLIICITLLREFKLKQKNILEDIKRI